MPQERELCTEVNVIKQDSTSTGCTASKYHGAVQGADLAIYSFSCWLSSWISNNPKKIDIKKISAAYCALASLWGTDAFIEVGKSHTSYARHSTSWRCTADWNISIQLLLRHREKHDDFFFFYWEAPVSWIAECVFLKVLLIFILKMHQICIT